MNRLVDTPEAPQATDARQQWPTVESVHVGYLTLPQTAKYLGVSTATIRRWITSNALPHYHITGAGGQRGKLLFREGEIDRWMRRFRNGLAAPQGAAAAQSEAVTDETRAEHVDKTA